MHPASTLVHPNAALRPPQPAPRAHLLDPLHDRFRAVALRLGLLALMVGLLGSLAPPSLAGADPTSVEAVFLVGVARAREAHGLRAYDIGGALTRIAREQARRMAEQNTLFHNPNLTTDVTNWRWVGENVGFGPVALTVNQAFMDSAPHRANILDRDFTRIGIGAVVRNGRVWVSEVFKTPQTRTARQP
jgi:hypothetical protein